MRLTAVAMILVSALFTHILLLDHFAFVLLVQVRFDGEHDFQENITNYQRDDCMQEEAPVRFKHLRQLVEVQSL